MADGNSKKKRTHKISQGKRRSSRPVKLTRLQLALMGKGPTGTWKPAPAEKKRAA